MFFNFGGKKTSKKINTDELESGRISTLSQLGSRLSIVKLHIQMLFKAFAEDDNVNHVFYLVIPENKMLADYLSEFASKQNVSIYSKTDNDVTDFKRLKDAAPFGGDTNYEFLISRPEVGEFFLTLHDDSMLLLPAVSQMLRHYACHYDFIGYQDSRTGITAYDNLLIDGIPLSSLRLGTWFTFGNTKLVLDAGYKFGMYKTVDLAGLKKEVKDVSRLVMLTDSVWLNGGMPFNILMRLDNRRILMLDKMPENYAEHLTKVTGFFAARQMMKYADQPEEVDAWRDRFVKLSKCGAPPGTLYKDPALDKKFLLRLAARLEHEGISDSLLNTKTIEEICPVS